VAGHYTQSYNITITRATAYRAARRCVEYLLSASLACRFKAAPEAARIPVSD